jgi:hypothetical protein
MNVVAHTTLGALAAHGVPALPAYRRALVSACNATPPPFGKRDYGSLLRRCAADRDWVVLCVVNAALGEGEGAEHLWDLAASTSDKFVARQIQAHAIDESRHARGYLTLLDLIFPGAVSQRERRSYEQLSPGYTKSTPLKAAKGSAFAFSATVDELIQMNMAEIRTRANHILQRPIFLAYCPAEQRRRVRRILDSLLVDETRHIAYTARLIERAARKSGSARVTELMHERLRDFNEITEEEVARRRFFAE